MKDLKGKIERGSSGGLNKVMGGGDKPPEFSSLERLAMAGLVFIVLSLGLICKFIAS